MLWSKMVETGGKSEATGSQAGAQSRSRRRGRGRKGGKKGKKRERECGPALVLPQGALALMALGRVKVFCAILARGHVRWLDFALLPPLLLASLLSPSQYAALHSRHMTALSDLPGYARRPSSSGRLLPLFALPPGLAYRPMPSLGLVFLAFLASSGFSALPLRAYPACLVMETHSNHLAAFNPTTFSTCQLCIFSCACYTPPFLLHARKYCSRSDSLIARKRCSSSKSHSMIERWICA